MFLLHSEDSVVALCWSQLLLTSWFSNFKLWMWSLTGSHTRAPCLCIGFDKRAGRRAKGVAECVSSWSRLTVLGDALGHYTWPLTPAGTLRWNDAGLVLLSWNKAEEGRRRVTACVSLVFVYMHMCLRVFTHALMCEQCSRVPPFIIQRHHQLGPRQAGAAGLSRGYANVTGGVKYEF